MLNFDIYLICIFIFVLDLAGPSALSWESPGRA